MDGPGATDGRLDARVGSPRPSFDVPTKIARESVTQYLWGDEESGLVADWIYASTQRVHMLVYGLPRDGACRHSPSHRTIFGADVCYLVLEGTLALANPETGEVKVAEPGELLFFRKDTWHHIFSKGSVPLRVLEYFAPPPSTGTSRAYAATRPYLERALYELADDVGSLPSSARNDTLWRVTAADAAWRLEGSMLVGLLLSTEHLHVATLRLRPSETSDVRRRGGDTVVYVTQGSLHVRSSFGDTTFWFEINEGDAFFAPAGAEQQFFNYGGDDVHAALGVAPAWYPT